MTPRLSDKKSEKRAPSALLGSFQVLGDGWAFFVIREAFFGVRRFDDFQRALGIPRARLIERLTHLLDEGVLTKNRYSDHPPRFEYLLSEKGHDIYGMTLMMKQWGDKWRRAKPRPNLNLIHQSCGEPLRTDLICRSCRSSVQLSDVEFSRSSIAEAPPHFGVRRQLMARAFEQDMRNDSVARTLAVIGDQWTLMVLKEAFEGVETFETWKVRLGVARSTLSVRLKHLVEEGVLEKVQYQQKPVRYAYRLTEAGRDLFRVGLLMLTWGEKWMSHSSSSDRHLVHKTCGDRLEPVVVCEACGEVVTSRTVTIGAPTASDYEG
jgi:DNA-binding HxlR family transcriptional regulator